MNKSISTLFSILENYTKSIILKEIGNLDPPIDIYKIADNYGLYVFEDDMGENESGAIVINDTGTGIMINKRDTPYRKRFTLAHELGHFISYRYQGKSGEIIEYRNNKSSLGKSVEEVFANKFAAAILMPKQVLVDIKKAIGNHLEELADIFEVSKTAIENRLENI